MAVCKFADCRRSVKKIDKKKAAICKICKLPQICDPRNFPMLVLLVVGSDGSESSDGSDKSDSSVRSVRSVRSVTVTRLRAVLGCGRGLVRMRSHDL